MITVHYADGESEVFGEDPDSSVGVTFEEGWITIEVRDGLASNTHWINTGFVRRIDSGTEIFVDDGTDKEKEP